MSNIKQLIVFHFNYELDWNNLSPLYNDSNKNMVYLSSSFTYTMDEWFKGLR